MIGLSLMPLKLLVVGNCAAMANLKYGLLVIHGWVIEGCYIQPDAPTDRSTLAGPCALLMKLATRSRLSRRDMSHKDDSMTLEGAIRGKNVCQHKSAAH